MLIFGESWYAWQRLRLRAITLNAGGFASKSEQSPSCLTYRGDAQRLTPTTITFSSRSVALRKT